MAGSDATSIVLDANVVFDFDSVGYLGQMLRLNCNFHTTNLIEREIKSVSTTMLRACGLHVATLTGAQGSEMGKIRDEFRGGPSIQDVSAFIHARDNDYALATRDSGLWQVANETAVLVYQTHELLDMMISQELTSRSDAADILSRMNVRQPVKIQRWIDLIKTWRQK
jgi:hypothetical protein